MQGKDRKQQLELPRGQKQNQKIKNVMTPHPHPPPPSALALERLLAASSPAFRVLSVQTVNRDWYLRRSLSQILEE